MVPKTEEERKALGDLLREAYKHYVESARAGTLDLDSDDPWSPEYRELFDPSEKNSQL